MRVFKDTDDNFKIDFPNHDVHICEHEQGTNEWLNDRKGIITASDMGKIISPKGKKRSGKSFNDFVLSKASEIITGKIETIPETFDMQRGKWDEIHARSIYSDKMKKNVKEFGLFIKSWKTDNCKMDFKIGYSPDGVVEDGGLIEIKSKKPYRHLDVILNGVPDEHKAQLQTALLVTESPYIDFISYPAFGGGKMIIIRVKKDDEYQKSILDAVNTFYNNVFDVLKNYMKKYNVFVEVPSTYDDFLIDRQMFGDV